MGSCSKTIVLFMSKGNSSIKVAIITGGNKGIGAAITRAFLEEGYSVIVGARTESIDNSPNENLRSYQMDVRREEDHEKLVRHALEWKNQIDVYINCAGFSGWRPIQEVDESFWNEMLDTNLKGTMWGCKVASKYLSDGGAIINISSIAGKRGSANNSVYCASKFGVNGVTQSLAKELGPRGIRVNAVCPVLIKTPGLVDALQDPRSPVKGADMDTFFQNFAQTQSALGRLPRAEEVASACVFLASRNASAITGQCINVDCGVLPQ